jgi:hypothetical protein
MDADGQHAPEWIEESMCLLAEGVDVAFANRFACTDGVPLTKIISNNLAWYCLKRIIGRAPVCEDVSCGFRAYSRRGLLATIASPATAAEGYAFTHATCVHLHQSGLRLAAFKAAAIYPEGVLGTSLVELTDFLLWLQSWRALKREADAWLTCLSKGDPLVFDFESWGGQGMLRAVGRTVGDQLILQYR